MTMIGIRIYNHGSCHGSPHHGTITAMVGDKIQITPDRAAPYWVHKMTILAICLDSGPTHTMADKARNCWLQPPLPHQCHHQYVDGVCELCDWSPERDDYINRRRVAR